MGDMNYKYDNPWLLTQDEWREWFESCYKHKPHIKLMPSSFEKFKKNMLELALKNREDTHYY